MAQLKDLIVSGATRLVGATYASTLQLSGSLILAKVQDASGTANNMPALIIGGLPTATHIEIDENEIMAKSNGTTTGPLYLNNDGGAVYFNGSSYISGTSFSGTAASANKINTNAGSSQQPVYFTGGVPVEVDFHIGNSSIGERNANNITYNAIGYYTSNGPTVAAQGIEAADASIYVQAYSSAWVGQIAQDYRTGQLWGRSRNNGSWQSWKKVVMADENSTNITNCNSVKFTGIWTNSGFTNRPNSVQNYGSLFNIRLYNDNNNYHRQLFFDCYATDRIWTRSMSSTSWTSWKMLVNTGTESAGVGSSTQPVYITSAGVAVAITSYSGTAASATYATSAGYASTAGGCTSAGTASSLGWLAQPSSPSKGTILWYNGTGWVALGPPASAGLALRYNTTSGLYWG